MTVHKLGKDVVWFLAGLLLHFSHGRHLLPVDTSIRDMMTCEVSRPWNSNQLVEFFFDRTSKLLVGFFPSFLIPTHRRRMGRNLVSTQSTRSNRRKVRSEVLRRTVDTNNSTDRLSSGKVLTVGRLFFSKTRTGYLFPCRVDGRSRNC